MGWDISYGRDRKAVIAELNQGWSPKIEEGKPAVRYAIRKHALRGNELWQIVDKYVDGQFAYAFIALHLVRKERGGIAVKGMAEQSHPFYYKVPLSWLEEVPVPPNEDGQPSSGATSWRESVRILTAKAKRIAGLQIGAKIKFNQRVYELAYKAKKTWVGKRDDGQMFRLPTYILQRSEVLA